eukprot:CAMPEP_0170313940 /NCGR_PEP_ID=MMETSP0116_2-20130129/57537_1 /TAXON_ID=400756 /ORGANISM="Durinskia baltica, Strain CSIRO CS-38" /LENGTH=68 /DNA_ID=CAMNT_0010566377 /DNA_START=56 /DNA_END=260 /DNA_ORIENTATION=-
MSMKRQRPDLRLHRIPTGLATAHPFRANLTVAALCRDWAEHCANGRMVYEDARSSAAGGGRPTSDRFG